MDDVMGGLMMPWEGTNNLIGRGGGGGKEGVDHVIGERTDEQMDRYAWIRSWGYG